MVKRDQEFHTNDEEKVKERTSESKQKRKRKRRRKPRLTGLSKERQTANARERCRMRSISDALLHLRGHLPSTVVPKNQKLSKIQTLRLAIGYISDLWQDVQNNDGRVRVLDNISEISGQEEVKEVPTQKTTSSGRIDSVKDCPVSECVYCDSFEYFIE
ncbi:pancreas transcription factor 1 subunit alpha-like [Actinia tenebrosa]|uniref:Pancreas transcription factor 1 subunit alpha-like n=1 Tax=Actinia tenebrosa TaxID=6105 RepID=A0A6P8I024_ACTTE|nr:pancreas transcription factor 1 subunit alpha-like [Actinia tenebrosa]